MLKTVKLPVGPMGANCYLAWDSEDGQAVIIDPGDEHRRIIHEVEKRALEVRWILNTHGHADHIGANAGIKKAFGAPLLIHEADAPMLTDPNLNLSAFFGAGLVSPPPDDYLVPGREVVFGGQKLQILHTPGHTPGGVCLYGGGVVFTGDALFCQSIGRYDLPGGDERLLIQAIRDRLLTLPDSTEVLPGHGPNTTIAEEKAWNPFLNLPAGETG